MVTQIQAKPTPDIYDAGAQKFVYLVSDDVGTVVADDQGTIVKDDQ